MNALLAIESAVAEAVDPKRLIRVQRTAELANRIWPGNNYYLNVAKPDEPWEEAEFCPVMVDEEGNCVLQDGMYGLDAELRDAVHYHEANPASEEELEKWLARYEGTMLQQVRNGVTSGTVNGIVGARRWRLVYIATQHQRAWSPADTVQVQRGVEYGPRLSVREAIDPKGILQKLRAGKFVKVVIRGNNLWAGSLEINGSGQTRNEHVKAVKGFERSWVDRILRDIRRGKSSGNFGRWIPLWWDTDDRATVHDIASNQAPMLVVTTFDWTIYARLIVGEHGELGWQASNLTPQQKAFMREHGESIWYAMNEGGDMEDDIRDYPENGDEVVVGSWLVTGDPDKAPPVQGEWSYD